MAEERRPSHFKRPQSVQGLVNYGQNDEVDILQAEKNVNRVGSVVSIIDGGFTGFSDSDEEEKKEETPKRPETP